MKKSCKKLGNLTVLLALVASSLAFSATPSVAHNIGGFANDGYCAWGYSLAISRSNSAQTWAARQTTDCRFVDADLTLYYQGFARRSKYCPPSTNFAYCAVGPNNAISRVTSRVRGMDRATATWQTLYKYHR